MEYCDICWCPVPSTNWTEHINGRRHLENIDDQCYDDDNDCENFDCDYGDDNNDGDNFDCDTDDGGDDDDDVGDGDGDDSDDVHDGTSSVHFNNIVYTQDSIGPTFQDGTTLEEGVENVLAGYSYPIEVYDMGNGDYAARNNRTLFCYEKAGFHWFPVVVVGPWYGRNTFSEAPRVRGESSF
ncbi:membrane-associated protein, putative [Bodo saltans]|uniref:Membrane-associated protein, putative n=1 Tax=Bodo saltans TaxID=75058 RepID=A0A0S4IW16_BODSA|nr:membrane-associated protein, putative [Bodo saltans]|eukprot:CUG03338.1 membrane-associated protein, putative [Bodo saltans]